MISGVCERGVCTSFSVLEIPVVLESSFSFRTQVVGGVLVYMRDPLLASRSFSTSSSPLANLASRLSRAQFFNIHTWISLSEVSAHLQKINRFVPTISVETMTFSD